MDLHKHTVNELLNISGGANRFEESDKIYINMPIPDGAELITDDNDRDTFSSHNWVKYGTSANDPDVFRGDLRFVSTGVAYNQGVQLPIANLTGPDGTNSIEVGTTYYLEVNLDTTSGYATPALRCGLGGSYEVLRAQDGDPNDGTINTTAQVYRATITPVNNTEGLLIYHESSDNASNGTTRVVMTDFSLRMTQDTTDTRHYEVSGKKHVQIYTDAGGTIYSFSTTPKDISGTRGANGSGYGNNLITNSDFESSSGAWDLKYEGGSGSSATLDKANTSSPVSGSKDMKLVNSEANKIAAARSNSLTQSGRDMKSYGTYRVSFKYKTNYDGGNQPDPMQLRITTAARGGSGNDPMSPIIPCSTTPQIIHNERFDAGTEANGNIAHGNDTLYGYKVYNGSGNTMDLTDGVLTFTYNNIDTHQYIWNKGDDLGDVYQMQPGETYLVRVVIDSVSGDQYPKFELGGGYGNRTVGTTAGTYEFLFAYDEAIQQHMIDNDSPVGPKAAVLARRYGYTGTFAISHFSVTLHSTDNKPYKLDLNATSTTEEVFYFQTAHEDGTQYLNFCIDNTGSTDSEFQVDDIRIDEVNGYRLEWSTNDLSLPGHSGVYLIPVPDLGETVYFNFINDRSHMKNKIIAHKL